MSGVVTAATESGKVKGRAPATGGAVGGSAGTNVVLATSGKEVRLGQGAALTVELTEPLTIRIKAARRRVQPLETPSGSM